MNELTTLQKLLLENFEDTAGSEFYTSLIEGFFEGPLSRHWSTKISRAQNWLKYESPAIQKWAGQIINSLSRIRDEEKMDEDEEALFGR